MTVHPSPLFLPPLLLDVPLLFLLLYTSPSPLRTSLFENLTCKKIENKILPVVTTLPDEYLPEASRPPT